MCPFVNKYYALFTAPIHAPSRRDEKLRVVLGQTIPVSAYGVDSYCRLNQGSFLHHFMKQRLMCSGFESPSPLRISGASRLLVFDHYHHVWFNKWGECTILTHVVFRYLTKPEEKIKNKIKRKTVLEIKRKMGKKEEEKVT